MVRRGVNRAGVGCREGEEEKGAESTGGCFHDVKNCVFVLLRKGVIGRVV